jgi:chemotaxis protein methyltransferase CheR
VEIERLNPRQFDRFRKFIYKNSGIRIDDKKTALLSNRIRRRLRAGNFANFDVYYRYLTSPPGARELESFLDAITTSETSFFRTPDHFEWLRLHFLPELVAAARRGERQNSLRIWSAGCASGAEPYSIAICVAENAFRLRDWSVSIVGTDISQEQLRLAREGVFKSRAIDTVSDSRLRRYFQTDKKSETWRVRPEIKRLVEFRHHNLLTPLGPPAFDCIFIRNVLIYFDRDSKQAVVDQLIDALAPKGYLVVGPSEGIYELLGLLKKQSPFLYQKV